ncbi:MAG: cation diffusion facilitator family transporter [Clostridiales bacterium]|nr:cation diffusion facilitator family transporter [Clostridiales bacterium]
MDERARQKTVQRVCIASMVANGVLFVLKAVAAVCTHSDSMAGDCLHTLSDLGTTVIVLIGCALAARKADAEHPYGHEKLEYIASIVLGVLLAAVGASLIIDGVKTLRSGGVVVQNGMFAVLAAVASIAVKECMFWGTRHYAIKIGSGALRADAWHHRSDALSSVGSLIGVWCAMAGFPKGDSIAALVIGALIALSGIAVIAKSAERIDDHAAPKEIEAYIASLAAGAENVKRAAVLRTRLHGGVFFAELAIYVEPELTVLQAHETATCVHDLIEEKTDGLKHVTVLVYPYFGKSQIQ